MLIGLALFGGGIAAGLFGSLLGLGGGILIVPFLTLVFGLPIQQAVGVSLVCVIVTSGAAAAVYLERRVANLRLGMLLELFTAGGAVIGGAIAFLIDGQVLAGLFTLLLLYTAATMARRRESAPAPTPEVAAAPAGEGTQPDAPITPPARASFVASLSGPGYTVTHLRGGTVGAVFAGVMSALLGIGGGLVKVP
ncbi:MAG TPA: sulfite exporter TauE/SafE family protein, partial [Candidatus Limnocylindrales bacterium]